MNFTEWYDELKSEDISEPWCISHEATPDFTYDPDEWVTFLNAAFKIRQERTPDDAVYTTYAWFDEQASQLRFATTQCEIDSLPFGCEVELIDSPIPVISAWLTSPDHIPMEELHEVDDDDDSETAEVHPLQVWAIRHKYA